MPLTQEQEAVRAAIVSGQDIRVNAVAGSGKTTTLVAGCNDIPQTRATLALAFNKSIQLTLQQRVPSHIFTKTLNGLGHGAWAHYLKGKRLHLDTAKTLKIVKDLNVPEDIFMEVVRLTDAAKMAGIWPIEMVAVPFLADTFSVWEKIAYQNDLDTSSVTIRFARQALIKSISAAFEGNIDFNDQLYMPVMLKIPTARYKQVLIDEAQDLNQMQHTLVSMVVGGSVVAVGDPFQAIYGFRGALTNSMDLMQGKFKLQDLPMSICFRCPQSIISLAQQYAPQIRWREGAPEGIIKVHETWDCHIFSEHDIVLCRNVAPLIKLAFRCIRAGVKVSVAGRDIGKSITALINKIARKDKDMRLVVFWAHLERWQEQEIAKARVKFDDAKIDSISDKAETIRNIDTTGDTVADLLLAVEAIFDDSKGGVRLSTIHRAKGLEWPRVYWLDSWRGIARAEKSGDSCQLQEEKNLQYVAMTRAEQELHYIESDDYNRKN